ncbi:MAG: hypothetical protein ACI8Q9_000788 [Planctomycetota bacterium]|jgi:hypothetical protein
MENTENENLAIGPLFMTTFVLTGVVVTCFFALTGLKNYTERNLIQAFQEQRPQAALENDAAQAARLDGYAAIDKETGRYQIPVDKAMDLIIEQRQAE